MNGATTFKEMAETLSEQSFYDIRHQYTWKAMKKAAEGPFAAFIDSSVVLATENQNATLLGGEAYLLETELHFATTMVEHFRKIVLDAQYRRDIFYAAESIQDAATFAMSHLDAMSEAQNKLREVEQDGEELVDLKDMLRSTMAYVMDCYHGKVDRFEFGVEPVDEKLVFRAPDLLVIAGRPGTGKTACAIQCAEHNALLGHHVGFVSAEMLYQELLLRMISRRSGVPTDRLLREKGIEDQDISKVTHAITELMNLPLHIDDTVGISINQVEARARQWKRKHDIKLLVVDYLQKIKGDSDKEYASRDLEVGDVITRLKDVGKELNLAVVCLAQIGRSVERRRTNSDPFPRPTMGDLRESGQIENEANSIILLHRYEDDDVEHYEALIRKQRQGESPVDIPMHYNKKRQTFYSVDSHSNFAGGS